MFAIFGLISLALNIVTILLLVRVIVSWVPPWQRTLWARVVKLVTEPLLMPLRRIAQIPVTGGIGIDFSPMLALLIIQLGRQILHL